VRRVKVQLQIREVNTAPSVAVLPRPLVLGLRPGISLEKHQHILAARYRNALTTEAAGLIEPWQQRLGVQRHRLFIQSMRRQWGSCNPATRNIRLKTQLAQKPRPCLEYSAAHHAHTPAITSSPWMPS
jgi:predicted metal-dependent hydrolase